MDKIVGPIGVHFRGVPLYYQYFLVVEMQPKGGVLWNPRNHSKSATVLYVHVHVYLINKLSYLLHVHMHVHDLL